MHSSDRKLVALLGAPNSGKTTLFNHLTGLRSQTANYPGNTVDYSLGALSDHFFKQANKSDIDVIDTPGTYSLFPKSMDEQVSVDALFGTTLKLPSLVVAVIDVNQISRHLLMLDQLKESGFPVVVAVTMGDMLAKRDLKFNSSKAQSLIGAPVFEINGQNGAGVDALVDYITGHIVSVNHDIKKPEKWSEEQYRERLARYAAIQDQVIEKIAGGDCCHKQDEVEFVEYRFEKWDRVLLHPVWGLVIFFLVMAGLFTSIFWVASPIMNFIDTLVTQASTWILDRGQNSLLSQFLANALVSGLGAIIIFVPQIAILFFGLTSFEASGYLARAATLIDKPLAKIGLNGRSFIPLLSGFACAIPAMMATRTIASKKERWLTLFIVPLMSCSARLPVYALLLAYLFRNTAAWKAGIAMAGVYFLSLFFGGLVSTLFQRFIKITDNSFFMLELPAYRKPNWSHVFKTARDRTQVFLQKAGPFIFIFSLLIWLGTNFPNYDEQDSQVKLSQSYLGMAGQFFEPVFEPMGADWRVGVGLMSAFAAREVFVSSLAVVLNATDVSTGDESGRLLSAMQQATLPDGTPLFTTASVIGLVLFFMIALQCMSTVAVARREFGNWRDPLIQLVAFNVLAYIIAVSAVQGLRALGIQ